VTRAAVVANPVKTAEAHGLEDAVGDAMREAGWEEPLWVETTADDPGRTMTREAVRAGVDLVVACGGDGTVMAVADGVAGTGVPLAVVPAGTGNLLARNLDIPIDVPAAIETALTGTDRKVDLGHVEERRFAVMAGIGFDAAVMADAPEGLKRVLGWPAYIVSGLRHLRDRRMSVTVRVDDGAPVVQLARTVLVGNVGRLQGGIPLIPDAAPDDGLLDIVVVAPRGLFDWLRLIVAVLLRRDLPDRRLERFRGRAVRVDTNRPQPRQLDGDPIEDGSTLHVEVEPGALLVRVPPAAVQTSPVPLAVKSAGSGNT